MRRRQALSHKAPFVGVNPYRFGSMFIAALELGDGYLCIEHQIGIDQVIVFAAKKDDFPRRYNFDAQADLGVLVLELKRRAMHSGATLEAIQLLGQLTKLTKEEEKTMAENKLAKANTQALKAAAKAVPTGGKKAAPAAKADAPKRKGNPEALAAARAARQTGPDNRKITVVNKDHGARAGTKRANMLDIVLKSKTVQGALDAGATRVDINFAKAQGLITVA